MRTVIAIGAGVAGLGLLVGSLASSATVVSPGQAAAGGARARAAWKRQHLRSHDQPVPCSSGYPTTSFNAIRGVSDHAGGDDSAVLAGKANDACDAGSSVSGGDFNVVGWGAPEGFIGGGNGNGITNGAAFIGAGSGNTVSGSSSGDGAGASNSISISAGASFIGAGEYDTVSGSNAFLGAGENNTASGDGAFIGSGNTIVGEEGSNTASGQDAFVGAGDNNTVSGVASFIGAGGSISGSLGSAPRNQVSGQDSFVGAGDLNLVTGAASFVGAGGSGAAANIRSGSVYNLVSGADSFIGAGDNNTVSGNGSFIGAGGFTNTAGNAVSSIDSFVGAGDQNNIAANLGFIGSGQSNRILAGAGLATIGGGNGNVVSGTYGAVGGGEGNLAAGRVSTVPGGFHNIASGVASLAAGYIAEAVTAGSFAWSDESSSTVHVRTTVPNEFVARAAGGVNFYSDAALTSGVHLAAGSGTWSSLSDRALKTGVVPLDDATVLAKVAALPVSEWSYTSERGVRHVGPMAQDFYAAFRVGEDDRHITTIDEDGVALAAIKALHAENAGLRVELTEVRARQAALEREVAALARMARRR